MVRITSFLLCLGALICASCSSSTPHTQRPLAPSNLIGDWSGIDTEGKSGEIQFFADGRIVFVLDSLRIGDDASASPFKVTYKVDATVNPWHLDVIAAKDGVDLGVLRGLIEMIDESTLRVGFDTTSKTGFGDPRPASFSVLTKDSIIVLKKVAPSANRTTK